MYNVESYVDANNSFGAEIRSEYMCTMHVLKDLTNNKAKEILKCDLQYISR